MKPANLVLTFFFLLTLAACGPTRPQDSTVTDPADSAPQRIISLSLMTDEYLMLLGASDQVLALSNFADQEGVSNVYREARRVKLRSYAQSEWLASQNPDLILLADWASQDLVLALDILKLPYVQVKTPIKLQEIQDSVTLLGRILGRESEAGALSQSLKTAAEVLSQFRAELPPSEVLSVLEYDPAGSSGGGETLWGEMARLAGLKNLAENLPAGNWGYATVSREALIQLNPYFLSLPDWSFDPQFPSGALLKSLQSDPALQGLEALGPDRVLTIPESWRSSASPYFLRGVFALTARAYPARWQNFWALRPSQIREELLPWVP